MKKIEFFHRPRLAKTNTVARYLGLSPSRFYQIQNEMPFKPKKLGPAILWDLNEIDRYLDSLQSV